MRSVPSNQTIVRQGGVFVLLAFCLVLFIAGDGAMTNSNQARASSAVSASGFTARRQPPPRLANIGIVFTKSSARSLELQVAINSLLARRNPDECHMNLLVATDDNGRVLTKHILRKTVFSTHGVNVSYYGTDAVKRATSGLKSRDREDVCVWKASPELIFTDAEDAVVLDFDIIFVGDVCDFYDKMKAAAVEKPGSLMTVTMELSSVYSWPGNENIGCDYDEQYRRHVRPTWNGINSGVTFFRLEEMRRTNWTAAWRAVVEPLLANDTKRAVLAMPEQNVFNFMCRFNRTLTAFVPPTFNMQLYDNNDPTILRDSIRRWEEPYVIHGNAVKFGEGWVFSQRVWWHFLDDLHLASFRDNKRPGDDLAIFDIERAKMFNREVLLAMLPA